MSEQVVFTSNLAFVTFMHVPNVETFNVVFGIAVFDVVVVVVDFFVVVVVIVVVIVVLVVVAVVDAA